MVAYYGAGNTKSSVFLSKMEVHVRCCVQGEREFSRGLLGPEVWECNDNIYSCCHGAF